MDGGFLDPDRMKDAAFLNDQVDLLLLAVSVEIEIDRLSYTDCILRSEAGE